MMRTIVISCLAALYIILNSSEHATAKTVEYDLTISRQEINITGADAQGMTINGEIPGPVLFFTEGDLARIRVHNDMDVDTSIHWHGLLVPPGMDGVPLISFPPIDPGSTFTYEFPVRQNGTYWYHSHTELQEQRGVYGGIVVKPQQTAHVQDADHVIVLSDWTDENPHAVLRTLKQGSEWYSIEKGSAQSILGAARLGMLNSYFQREMQRMPAMDISDIAYDRFLANGKTSSTLTADPGDTVRLRVINGSATTYFHLDFAGGPMTIISADGQNVHPVEKKRFLIGVAETYDVLVTVPGSGAYEFRATAHDGSGFSSVWLGEGMQHLSEDIPRPNLYHSMGHSGLKEIFALTPAGSMGMADNQVEAGKFDAPGMMGMQSMGHMGTMRHMKGDEKEESAAHAEMAVKHHGQNGVMATDDKKRDVHHPRVAGESGKKYGRDFRLFASDVSSSARLAIDGMDPRRPGTPYKELRSIEPADIDMAKPVRDIRLTLDGDMERYVWLLNNKPLSESDSIRIREGEVVRFIMINRTMMHHPMHLHGHFFRVINGQGDHAPLKHTVDVAPMTTTVIEFDANEFGDWFFHCHLLYHMKSGMARVVHYDNYNVSPELSALRPKLYKESWYFQGQADILSNMTEGFLALSDTRNIAMLEWEAGWGEVDDSEWEGIFTWSRYVNRFFSFFAGVDVTGEKDEADDPEGVVGLHYLLPLNLESRLWLDTQGDARFLVEKTLELTPRIALYGEVEYDTEEEWEGKIEFSYLVSKSFSAVAHWHSEFGYGLGVQLRF